ncbi:Eukaryotic translation initiation factor eIF-1 [Cystobasidiomycetes sp. EMM_F5]
MSSNNDSAAHAPASALENSEPSAVAVAAVEGKSLPAADKLEDLASKLDIKDISATTKSNGESKDAAKADGTSGEAAAVKKKKVSSKSKTEPSSKASGGASSKVQNLATYDPFADEDDDEIATHDALAKSTKAPEYIHIRIQQRNGRKTVTTVQGIPDEYDPKKLLKHFKKEYACNGTLVEDEDLGQVIQLQGDQRAKISQTLIEDVGLPKDTIKIHGF